MATQWVWIDVQQLLLFPEAAKRRPPVRHVLVPARRRSRYARQMMQMHREYRHRNRLDALLWGLSCLMEIRRTALLRHADTLLPDPEFSLWLRELDEDKAWLESQIREERARRRRVA